MSAQQNYSFARKSASGYDVAIAKLSSASSDDYHYEDCDDGVKIVFHISSKFSESSKLAHSTQLTERQERIAAAAHLNEMRPRGARPLSPNDQCVIDFLQTQQNTCE